MIRWAVMLALAAGCGADSTSSSPRAVPLPVCALCDSDMECETGICREYGDGYRKCSTTCTAGDIGPVCSGPPSGGCNLMGYCTCPPYAPPPDADPSGIPKDAPTAPTTDAGP